MKKTIHSLYLEAFSYPSEDEDKVFQALTFILGEDKKLKADRVESHHGSIITRLFFETSKWNDIKEVLNNIFGKLSEKDRKTILETLKDRTDEEGNFYMRFGKQEAYQGKLVLLYHGDVIKIRMKVASYPFSIENIEKNVREIFEKKVL